LVLGCVFQNLAHEPQVLKEGLLQLSNVLERLHPLHKPVKAPGSSVLLHELASAPNLDTAFTSVTATPLLHAIGAAHGYVVMFVHVCRTGQVSVPSLHKKYMSVVCLISVLAQHMNGPD
jgi:E3 ubiquitin-protein ligase HUWE1